MATETRPKKKQPSRSKDALSNLRNVGPATRENFRLLGIDTLEQLVEQDAGHLYAKLNATIGVRADPCLYDVFSAAIHQARTGEALPWWHFSTLRKQHQRADVLSKSLNSS